jgi:hypothetical protein
MAAQRDSSVAAMKAILLRRPGGPDALEYTDEPTPVPGGEHRAVSPLCVSLRSTASTTARISARRQQIRCSTISPPGGSSHCSMPA